MSLLQANEAPLHLPTQAQEVYDDRGGRYCYRRAATVLQANH